MRLLDPLPPPTTKLGRYRVLSPNASVRVSPLCLGAMNIGDKWRNIGMGSMDKEESFKFLDEYFKGGGNFIDTANNYQDGDSEAFIGEWAESRGIRDQLVIATKYSTRVNRTDDNYPIKVNYAGNSMKALHLGIEDSLKKLRTSYVDLFYLHFWDWNTSVEEIMNGLHNLVVSGKVLYLGISDAPAWVVSKANTWARCHGKTPFSVYQGRWSILSRGFETDIIPMARSEGLALCPWGVLGSGRIRTDEEEQRRRETGELGRLIATPTWERTPDEVKVCRKLEEIAKEVGANHINAVAISYVMHKAPYVFPIIGGRKIDQFKTNLGALDVTLTPEHIKALESVLPFNGGFPSDMIGTGLQNPFLMAITGTIDKWPLAQPMNP